MVKVKDLYEEPYALVGHVRICEGRKPKQRRNKMRKEKRKSLGAVTHTHTHTHKTFTKETESKPILWWNPSTRQP